MWESELIASDGTRKPIKQHEFLFRADHLNQCGWWDLEETVKPSIGGSLAEQKANYELKVKILSGNSTKFAQLMRSKQ